VTAEHQYGFGRVDPVYGGAGAGQSELRLKEVHGRGIAKAGLRVQIVGADGHPEQFLEEVVFFVGDPGGADACHGVGPAIGDDGADFFGDLLEGGLPIYGPLVAVGVLDKRGSQPVRLVEIGIAEAAVDAEVPLVVGRVVTGDPLHLAVLAVVFD